MVDNIYRCTCGGMTAVSHETFNGEYKVYICKICGKPHLTDM